jgi:hypothetical protein
MILLALALLILLAAYGIRLAYQHVGDIAGEAAYMRATHLTEHEKVEPAHAAPLAAFDNPAKPTPPSIESSCC